MYNLLCQSIARAESFYATATTDAERMLALQIMTDAHALLPTCSEYWFEA